MNNKQRTIKEKKLYSEKERNKETHMNAIHQSCDNVLNHCTHSVRCAFERQVRGVIEPNETKSFGKWQIVVALDGKICNYQKRCENIAIPHSHDLMHTARITATEAKSKYKQTYQRYSKQHKIRNSFKSDDNLHVSSSLNSIDCASIP